jgi:hypothetical protein
VFLFRFGSAASHHCSCAKLSDISVPVIIGKLRAGSDTCDVNDRWLILVGAVPAASSLLQHGPVHAGEKVLITSESVSITEVLTSETFVTFGLL